MQQQSTVHVKVKRRLFFLGLMLTLFSGFLATPNKGFAGGDQFYWIENPKFTCPLTIRDYSFGGTEWARIKVWNSNNTKLMDFESNAQTHNFSITFVPVGLYRIEIDYLTLNGRCPKRLNQVVSCRRPIPTRDAQEVTWCGGNETQTVTITGLNDDEIDCNFTGDYTYKAPSGWVFPGSGINEYTTNSRSVQLTTPPNVQPGNYTIIVEAPWHPDGAVPAHVGPPDPLTGTIIPQRNPICVNDRVPVTYSQSDRSKTYYWQLSNQNGEIVHNINTSIKVKGVAQGTTTIMLQEYNQCGGSSVLTEDLHIEPCAGGGGGGVLIPGAPINPFEGLTVVYGISPFAPFDEQPWGWTMFAPVINGITPGGDVSGSLDIGFVEAGDNMIVPDHDLKADYTVEVFDQLTGSLMLTQTDHMMETQLDISGLSAGTYDVKVTHGNEEFVNSVNVIVPCEENCFQGISPLTGNTTYFTPVISPNPTNGSGFMTVAFHEGEGVPTVPGATVGFTYEVEIRDLQGNLVFSLPGLTDQESYIGLMTIPNGTYVVRVTNGQDNYSTVFFHN